MRLVIIIIVVFLAENSLQKIQFYHDETASSVQSWFVNEGIRRYYEETMNVFVFARNLDILGQIFPTFPLVLISNWDTLTKAISKKVGSLIVILDSNTPDQNSYDLERLRGVRTRFPVLVVCNDATACSSEVYLKKIAKSTNSPLLHYAILYRGGSIEIYERTETTEGSCGIPRMVRISYNGSTAWPNDETFSKTVNYNKCPIRLATMHILSLSQPCNLGDSDHFCGLEGNIVKTFVNKINATVVTTIANNEDEIKNLVALRQADLGYGRLHVQSNETLVYTEWLGSTKTVILVPHSALGSGASLLTITSPLNREVWFGITVVIFLVSILGRMIPYFRRLSALQQFGSILGIAVPIQPRQFPQRIYFFSIVLFGFAFTQIYLINLTKIYSTSHPHLIKTLEELEESGLRVYGYSEGKKMLDEFGYRGLAENYQVVDHDKLLTKTVQVLEGQSSDPIYVEMNKMLVATLKHVEVLEEIAKVDSLAAVASNSSSFGRTIDQVILMVMNSGISEKLAALKPTDSKALTWAWTHGIHTLNSNETRELVKCSLGDLQGVFVLLTGGLILSIFIFIGEYVVNFVKVKPAANQESCAYLAGKESHLEYPAP